MHYGGVASRVDVPSEEEPWQDPAWLEWTQGRWRPVGGGGPWQRDCNWGSDMGAISHLSHSFQLPT